MFLTWTCAGCSVFALVSCRVDRVLPVLIVSAMLSHPVSNLLADPSLWNSAFCFKQEKLEAQQAALRARLQQALQLAKAPQTPVDTVTIADKAVHLLDIILEVNIMITLA